MNNSLSFYPHYDELITSLHQIDALLDIVTSVDTIELKPETLSNYFWIARDILNKAKLNCESLASYSLFITNSGG